MAETLLLQHLSTCSRRIEGHVARARRPYGTHGPAVDARRAHSAEKPSAPHRCGRDVGLTRQRLDAEVHTDAMCMASAKLRWIDNGFNLG